MLALWLCTPPPKIHPCFLGSSDHGMRRLANGWQLLFRDGHRAIVKRDQVPRHPTSPSSLGPPLVAIFFCQLFVTDGRRLSDRLADEPRKPARFIGNGRSVPLSTVADEASWLSRLVC